LSSAAKIITFTSRKGGVGKTVCTTLLARYYAEVEGKQVIVVDFDASCGITSIFCDRPIGEGDISIVELLQLNENNQDVQDALAEALIETGMEESSHWESNGGKIYLLPSKETLDQVIVQANPYALQEVLKSLDLPDNFIFLVDTGPEQKNVLMGVCAADIVFLPMMFSRQDVYPAVDTLRIVIEEQLKNGKAVLGGLIINDFGDTQWENEYADNFLNVFLNLRDNIGLVTSTDNIYVNLKRSKVIKRGKHLDWSFKDEFKNAAQMMAAAVHVQQELPLGVS
jgi:MinD-like ATPase involved in chromosome partitioning or flagellar assembly